MTVEAITKLLSFVLRYHVHLTRPPGETAAVGGRRGAPVVREVRSADMAAAGRYS